MIDARFLGGLASCLLLGTLAAAALGLLNAIAFQPTYAAAGLGLAGVLFTAPQWIYRQLKRSPEPEEPRDSLGALGAAAALVFAALGAFVLVASAVNDTYTDAVLPLFFPLLPVLAALAGLGREGWRATLRWLDGQGPDHD